LVGSKSPLVDRLTVEERPGKAASVEAATKGIHENPVRCGLSTRAVEDWHHTRQARAELGAEKKGPLMRQSHLALLDG
jgi:hypothetical protein